MGGHDLAALQGRNASGAVYGGSVASARIDIRDDFASAFAFGVEKRIENAGLADELQLATINFDNVQPWFAE
jgi:hypothetical protein